MKPYDQMGYHSLLIIITRLSHSIPVDMTAPTTISRIYISSKNLQPLQSAKMLLIRNITF